MANEQLVNDFENVMKMAQILMLLSLKLGSITDESRQNDILLRMKEYTLMIREREKAAWNMYITENKGTLV